MQHLQVLHTSLALIIYVCLSPYCRLPEGRLWHQSLSCFTIMVCHAGWFNLLGQVAITAGIDFTLAVCCPFPAPHVLLKKAVTQMECAAQLELHAHSAIPACLKPSPMF